VTPLELMTASRRWLNDEIVSTYREHGHAIARGVSPAMISWAALALRDFAILAPLSGSEHRHSRPGVHRRFPNHHRQLAAMTADRICTRTWRAFRRGPICAARQNDDGGGDRCGLRDSDSGSCYIAFLFAGCKSLITQGILEPTCRDPI
jgi:hypothetical protein